MSDAFNPDAYLAQVQQGQAFDPNQYLSAVGMSPQEPPGVGQGETFVNSSVNALPFGRQVTDALAATVLHFLRPSAGAKLMPRAKAELAAAGEAVPEEAEPTFGEDYRTMRSARGARTEEGERENPITAGAGKVAGTTLGILAPLPGFKVGGGVKGALASGAINGGLYGGLGGATGSEELAQGDVAGALKKGAEGLGLGAVLGAPLGAAGYGAQRYGADLLRRLALSSGRKVLTNGADSLSQRNAIPEDAVQAALDTAIKPFRTTEGVKEGLTEALEAKGEEYRSLVAELQSRGVQGPEARQVADRMLARGAALEPNEMNEAIPELYLKKAIQIEGKPPAGQANLGLQQALDLTRSMQRQAKYGRFEDTPVNEALKDIASIGRKSIEDQVAASAAAPGAAPEMKALASRFEPIKRQVGNLAEAEKAATRGAARGAQRGHVGPTELAIAAGELAHGSPGAALGAAGGLRLLRERLPSTTAYSLNLLRQLAERGTGTRGSSGFAAPELLERLRTSGRRQVPALATGQGIDLGNLGQD